MRIDNLEESDNDFVIYYSDLMEDDSAPNINIFEFLIRQYSLILTRVVMKVMIVGSESTLEVLYLDKFLLEQSLAVGLIKDSFYDILRSLFCE